MKPLVAVLPPLLIPSPIMWPLAARLRWAGFRPRVFRYRSHRRDIPQNAARLAAWLRGLKAEEPVHVVAFSLGSILLRWVANHHDIPPLGRVVMMGPPNHGAYMADWLDERLGPFYPVIYGKCARQLRRGDRGLAARAGTLPDDAQLGIIAGGLGRPRGYNPLIPGDNDMTVAVEETLLPGMRDFTLVPRPHTALVLSGKPAALAVNFLKTGRFRRRAVPAEALRAEPAPA